MQRASLIFEAVLAVLVIDSANSEYRLKIKEALCIRKQRPDLNAQIKSYKIRLTL